MENTGNTFCHKCGAKNRAEANFCKKCGAPLTHGVHHVETKPIEREPKEPVAPVEAPKADKIQEKKKERFALKISNKKLFIAGVVAVIVILIVVPEAKAYYDYQQGVKQAAVLFSQGKYSDAASELQSTTQSDFYRYGILSSDKNKLNNLVTEYSDIEIDDVIFQEAKQAETNGDLDSAKIFLASIDGKTDFPKLTEVNQELNKVNDGITAKIQEDADAKVAAANAQAQAEATKRKNAEAAAAKAAANAAANQAAAQAAEQEAQQQQAQAQAAEQQAQAAQRAAAQAQTIAQQQSQTANSNYVIALNSAMTLENTADTEVVNAVTAYIAHNFSLALSDLNQAEDDSYNSEHQLPETYPAIFQTANSDFINAANYCNLAAREFYTSMVNTTPGDQAFADLATGSSYYNRITSDLSAIGY